MISRREMLRVGRATASTILVGIVAGCASDGGLPDNEPTTTHQDTSAQTVKTPARTTGKPETRSEALSAARERLGALASDLRDVAVDDDTEYQDIDARQQPRDVDTALDAAEAAVETTTGTGQFTTLQTLRDVLELVIEASETGIENGLQPFFAARHRRSDRSS